VKNEQSLSHDPLVCGLPGYDGPPPCAACAAGEAWGKAGSWEQYATETLLQEIEDRRDEIGRDRLRELALDLAAVVITHPQILALARAIATKHRPSKKRTNE